jgi:hypothetical protein
MPGDDTAFDVGRAAGAEVDKEGDRLSLIERTLCRLSDCHNQRQDERCCDDSACVPIHLYLLKI